MITSTEKCISKEENKKKEVYPAEGRGRGGRRGRGHKEAGRTGETKEKGRRGEGKARNVNKRGARGGPQPRAQANCAVASGILL